MNRTEIELYIDICGHINNLTSKEVTTKKVIGEWANIAEALRPKKVN